MKHYHPCKDDNGSSVELKHPSASTPLELWNDINTISTVTPASPMPDHVAGIPIRSWENVPQKDEGWEELVKSAQFDEPAFKVHPGKEPASGVVVVEVDGRVWVVSPSNGFGGYKNTFPKGRVSSSKGISLRANAVKEAYEELGLQVSLVGFLTDSARSTTVTRYYLARRLTGNPADMGWESQAVHLVPLAQLQLFASHSNDKVIIDALKARG